MKALVVYESLFGNTEKVARAVGEGIGRHADVTVADVRGVRPEYAELFDLIVLGGPTHAFSMSRPATRTEAETKRGAPHRNPDTGIREWLAMLPDDLHPEAVATFDTKVSRARHLPGAARAAAREAQQHGLQRLVRPETFFVQDLRGPLAPGERNRAVDWGASLALRAGRLLAR